MFSRMFACYLMCFYGVSCSLIIVLLWRVRSLFVICWLEQRGRILLLQNWNPLPLPLSSKAKAKPKLHRSLPRPARNLYELLNAPNLELPPSSGWYLYQFCDWLLPVLLVVRRVNFGRHTQRVF
jgi:hypothetical protein